MKFKLKIAFILFFFLLSVHCFSQNITVLQSGKDTFIECDYPPYSAYRLSSSAKATLVASIKTAIEWSDLNKSHLKSFTKEINRFKVVSKENYKTFGYIDPVIEEAKVVFIGWINASNYFKVEVKVDNSEFLTFRTREDLVNFLNILQGRSGNSEVDNIFKN